MLIEALPWKPGWTPFGAWPGACLLIRKPFLLPKCRLPLLLRYLLSAFTGNLDILLVCWDLGAPGFEVAQICYLLGMWLIDLHVTSLGLEFLYL